MRIIQLTDLHINSEEEDTNGIDIRSNFLHILAEAKFAEPDYLIITGDLCLHKGDVAVYQWIKDRLEKTKLPYYVIPGNHDDRKMMRSIFEMDYVNNKDELYYALKLDKHTCLFMDSSAAVHSPTQLNWLKRQLKNATNPLLIFTHYPPVKAGVPFMDNNYPLKDQAAIQALLQVHPAPIYLFCGHYHVEKTIHIHNTNVHITPSCYVQIGQEKESFEIDHHHIALRIIDVDNNKIQTCIRYINGSLLG